MKSSGEAVGVFVPGSRSSNSSAMDYRRNGDAHLISQGKGRVNSRRRVERDLASPLMGVFSLERV